MEELASHGGSLRVFACRAESRNAIDCSPTSAKVIADEESAGLDSLEGYESFARQVKETKLALLEFLLTPARQGKSVAGYGAPGKSATLLHYCGIGKDLIRIHGRPQPLQAGTISAGHPHPDLSSGPDSRDQAGLRRDPALESERRNHGAVAVYPGVGRPLCRANSESNDLLKQRRSDYESRSILRRSRDAAQGIRRRRSQTHGADRDATDSLASDEILRPLRAQGLHPVPRI